MRKILLLTFCFFVFISTSFADSYIFYYGQGCPHCANVERYFKEDNIKSKYTIEEREVYFNAGNRDKFSADADLMGMPIESRGVPTLVVKDDSGNPVLYKVGDTSIVEYFKSLVGSLTVVDNVDTIVDKKEPKKTKTFGEHLAFFSILLPAAISDSINPCEFAVMLILLGSILIKYRKRNKVIWAGLLFSLAIFLSYFLMGLGIYSALGNFSNMFYFKLVVGILGIIVGLANLKDYFWYGKWFVMEVPFAWRKNMKKLLNSVTSPLGAFGVGFLVSLFLIPCTSGPYLVILGYLSSETQAIDNWGYLYLFVYNLFFILPMLIITFIVAFGKKSIEELELYRDDKIETIHLWVGILMLILGTYVIAQAFGLIS
ncbi:hypothetical protein EOM39_01685 [Candidatus Gracilibacteria bacterium]|nr:hypothetical protein [Candidatus Gracilibacteria bacterium]